MNNWILRYDSFDPSLEGIRESLCTLGNGYFAIRGAAEESIADEMHYPGTYLAGGYNRLKSQIDDKIIENEDLVNFPNCLPLTFRIDEHWFSISEVEILSYEQTLDLKCALLQRNVRFKDKADRITILSTRRFVSMENPHVVAIEMSVLAENWEGCIEIQTALDGRVENAGVERYMRLNRRHINPLEIDAYENIIYLKTITNQSAIAMAQAARTRISINGSEPRDIVRGIYKEKGYIAQRYKLHLERLQPVLIEKIICLYTSKDHAISECGYQARTAIEKIGTFESLFAKHQIAWKHLWNRFDIQIGYTGTEKNIPMLIRLHIFHILQTTSMHSFDLDTGVPPRGWHGEAYRGHILWDEVFIFSILNLQLPELTRTLLLYRYRRLPAARQAAAQTGLKGALYPWQSGSDGREESQKIHLNPLSGRWIPDNTHLERHVSAAIAYNIWQHFEATADLEFLSYYGAEMLLEIARLWVSLSTYNPEKDRYEICGVMGPDEYHDRYPNSEKPGIHNNAYTNILASWVLARALQALETIPRERREELEEILELSPEELLLWKTMRKKYFIPFHDGVISQFEGYEKLQELDWEAYKHKYDNIQRLDRILEAEGDDVNRYKVSKQADVLMLFYLFSAEELRALFEELGYKLQKRTIVKTVNYYMKRTSHGSTLSKMIHSWVLSRSDRKLSWDLFCQSIKSDLIDVQDGTTAEGIHLGAMAGTVDLIQRCYSGIELRNNILYLNPALPDELKHMEMSIRYRGHTLQMHTTHSKLRITSEHGSAHSIRIACQGKKIQIKEGQTFEFEISPKKRALSGQDS